MNVTSVVFLSAYLLVEMVSGAKISRFLGRNFIRLFICIDLAAQALVRFVLRPRFVLDGQCHRRGVCCRQIVFAPPALLRRQETLFRLVLAYHRVFHNFHAVGEGPNQETIFSCGHVLPSGRCGIYAHRPLLCRNYPVLPFFRAPAILPSCGFFAVPRVVKKMQVRRSLKIINAHVAIHHPTPPFGEDDVEDHYRWYDEESLREKSNPDAQP